MCACACVCDCVTGRCKIGSVYKSCFHDILCCMGIFSVDDNFYIKTAVHTCLYMLWFVCTTEQSSSSDGGPIKATAPMWRCSRIMHLLRDLHPTLLSALEGIVDQVHPLLVCLQ